MRIPSEIQMTAAPPAGAQGQAQTMGKPGLAQYIYWVVAHFPIGAAIGGPFVAFNAPNVLSASDYVLIVWNPLAGAQSYDVLRTDTHEFPAAAGSYALAVGLSQTSWLDQGAPLQPYDPSGLPHGSPVSFRITLNNRDFSQPTLEFAPWPLHVSTLIFSDGSMQWTAGGGGGGSAPILVGGTGIQLTSAAGPPPTVTISSNVAPSQWANVAGGIAYTGGRVGAGTATPAYALDVTGDINVTGQYRVNGTPFTGGGAAYVGTSPPASPVEGQLWFDDSVFKLFIRYSGTWIGLN